MPTKTANGLCQSCRNESDCTFPRKGREQLAECEEFDLPRAGVQRETAPARPAAKSTSRAAAEPELLGLCQNCRMLPGCLQPKPEGGIWFCEEYEIE